MTANIIDLRSHTQTYHMLPYSKLWLFSFSLPDTFFLYSFCITSYILFELFYLLIIRLCIFNIWYWDVFPKKIRRRQCSCNKLLYWVTNSTQSRWWYGKHRSSPETKCVTGLHEILDQYYLLSLQVFLGTCIKNIEMHVRQNSLNTKIATDLFSVLSLNTCTVTKALKT